MAEQIVTTTTTDGNKKITLYKPRLVGNCYDPEDHIYIPNESLIEQMSLIKRDSHFALYVNRPIYKRLSIDPNKEYGKSKSTGNLYWNKDEIICLDFEKTLYVLDENQELKHLETPLLDEADGDIELYPIEEFEYEFPSHTDVKEEEE